ncbi:P-loop containing nucleoside triphosphate hydrolase protein [Sporodiniella umbellata]|nr:P-loop containing nucleoside triphosphate hydrolase protein [Sporodiniella umbellata]
MKTATITFVLENQRQVLPSGKIKSYIKRHYFIISLLMSFVLAFYAYRITHNFWETSDPKDEGSILSPFALHKVTYKEYITNQPAHDESLQPKLYYPRICPAGHFSCAKPIPSFIFAGSELSGAFSIFQILKKHPQVSKDSVNHSNQTTVFSKADSFDEENAFERYMSQFPFVNEENQKLLVGEYAPQYLYSSYFAAKRIKETLPQVKASYSKEPIARAYLQYLKENSDSKLSFESLVDLELPTLRRCGYTSYQTGWEGFVRCHQGSEIAASWKTLNDSYAFNSLAKSLYYPALQPFLSHFSSSQLFVMKTEDVETNSTRALTQLALFLGIDPTLFPESPDLKSIRHPGLSIQFRLQKVFREINKRLTELFETSIADFKIWPYDVDQG